MSDLPVIAPRSQWGAKGSAGSHGRMAPGRRKVFIHHTVTPHTGDPCADMRGVERALIGRGLDPGYNWTVHPSGVLLEGAGKNIGAHTEGHNSEGPGFSFIGNYDIEQPTLAQLVNTARAINLLRLDGTLTPRLEDIEILGHRDTKGTACPGANLYPEIRWIRWFAHTGA